MIRRLYKNGNRTLGFADCYKGNYSFCIGTPSSSMCIGCKALDFSDCDRLAEKYLVNYDGSVAYKKIVEIQK